MERVTFGHGPPMPLPSGRRAQGATEGDAEVACLARILAHPDVRGYAFGMLRKVVPCLVLGALVSVAAEGHAAKKPTVRARVVHGPQAPHAAAHAPSEPTKAAEPHPPKASQGSLSGKTTLEPDFQAKVLKILDESRAPGGAIVVSDVRTGRVLAWATRGPGDWVKEAATPSASVFKIATTAALLERRKVSLTTKQCYSDTEHGITPGDLEDGPRDIGCAHFGEALGLSINGVFARLALKHLTPGELRSTAQNIGFGGKVPADIDAPFGDFSIPDDRLGFARSSAGFWNAKLSPLGALFAMQTIANDGEKVKLVTHAGDATPQRISLGRAMTTETARAMRQMLEVTTKRGTAAKAFHEDGKPALGNVRVAGKTGTLVGGHPVRMVSWFAGFAPVDSPKIAVAVLLSNDVSWWSKGNQVARRVFEAYFEKP